MDITHTQWSALNAWVQSTLGATNICMNLAMFLSCQASLAEKMAWLGQKQTKQAWQLKIAKFMQILVAPKADWT